MQNEEGESPAESPRRARRRQNLEQLLKEFGGAAQVARESGTPKSHFSAMLNKKRGLGDDLAEKLEKLYNKPAGWFDHSPALGNALAVARDTLDELTIPQYQTGGGMGRGLLLRDQPGEIHSWRVTPEWVQKNVHHFTAARNLAIVTGFGDSMRPMYNPGDPLLVDRGITSVEFDGIYFFRIDNEGFIKRLQRIPGVGLRAISENKAYESWDIKDGMDFEVFARVVKVWRGEDF